VRRVRSVALVHFTTSHDDAIFLIGVTWLVVHGNLLFILAEVATKDRSGVANVSTVDFRGGDEQDDCAGAGPVAHSRQIALHEFYLAGAAPLTQG